ncbi:hypothetical protein RFI_19073, partial [Reticulomyxa filosa]
ANATEIERERRHHATKIQRQLTTLQSQLREIDIEAYTNRLDEMVDLQLIMSDSKLKAFFCVFVQSFCQTLIDVELWHRQMKNATPKDSDLASTLTDFYGIENVLNVINSNVSRTLDVKINKTMNFIRILQRAISYQQQNATKKKLHHNNNRNAEVMPNLQEQEEKTDKSHETRLKTKIKMKHLIHIVLYVGRKLSYDEHMQEEIDDIEEVHAAKEILENVWSIEVSGDE